jgi:Zn-dependent peptidase ImmA (M78 family)
MSLLSEFQLEVLSRPPGADAAECVEAIAERMIDDLEVSEGPVDLAMAASLVDIVDIHVVPGLEAAGCLITPPGERSQIHLNASDHPRRRRFSTGHEITHTFFPGYSLQAQYRCAPKLTPVATMDLDIEALCDVGGAALILPRRLVRSRLEALTPTLTLAEEVADEFDASLIASLHRVAGLCGQPAAVLTLEIANKPSERGTDAPPALRVRSARAYGGGWPYIPQHKSAEPGDVFERALEGEVVQERRVELIGVTRMPIVCDVHAKLYPYRHRGELRSRVIALLTR